MTSSGGGKTVLVLERQKSFGGTFSAAVTGTEPLTRTAAAATAGATDMFFHATLARTFISALRIRGDDDVVDRLNYYYTPIMLAIACLVVSAKQFGGSPIECWVNPHSRESMEEYIEAFCWIQNTYWVPMYEHIPDSQEAREGQQIGYYQWVPFILIAQALMFSLPCILWRLLNWQNGTDIQHLISAACEARSVIDAEERERVTNSVSKTFIEMLDLREIENRPHPYASLMTRYKPTRLLNDHFLFGFQVLSDLFEGKSWTKSGHFPRVTLCDFEVRYLANLNRYTVQCALIINIINEKVFAFFWLWYCVLLCATTCSALFWLTNILLHVARVDYVLKFLQIAEHNERIGVGNSGRTPKHSQQQQQQQRWTSAEEGEVMQRPFTGRLFRVPSAHSIDKFVDEFLKSDGLFILRLVATNAGELVVVDIVKCLWREFSSRQFHVRSLVFENDLNDERRKEDEDCLLKLHTKGNGPVQQRKQSHRNSSSLGLPLTTSLSRRGSVIALDDSVGTPSPV
uniref:Innexin n=1 Tax=Globodera rostochiensis TaxID=31243 RepID=A0A914IB22_GLORO